MGYVFAVLCFAGWAFATVPMRGVTLPVPTMVTFGYLVGASVMLAQAKRADIIAFLAMARAHPWRVALQVFAYTATTLTYHWSIMLTSVANAALTHSAQPIFTCLLFVPLLTRRAPRLWTWLSVLLGFAGLYVALGDKLTAVDSWAGIALGTVSAVTYSIGLIQLNFFTSRVETRALMGCMMSISFFTMLPFALYERGSMPDLRGVVSLLAYAVLVFAAANLAFFAASKRIPESHLAILGYLEPVAAIVLAALFLGEPLTAAAVIGCVMVLGSGALLGFDRRRATASTAAPTT